VGSASMRTDKLRSAAGLGTRHLRPKPCSEPSLGRDLAPLDPVEPVNIRAGGTPPVRPPSASIRPKHAGVRRDWDNKHCPPAPRGGELWLMRAPSRGRSSKDWCGTSPLENYSSQYRMGKGVGTALCCRPYCISDVRVASALIQFPPPVLGMVPKQCVGEGTTALGPTLQPFQIVWSRCEPI